MKILVVYYSKSGTARVCSELLKKELSNHEVMLCGPDRYGEITGSFDEYDAVILGSSVRMGKMGKPFKKFVSLNAERLAAIPHAVFVVSADSELFLEYAQKNIPSAVLDSAIDVCYFGGRLMPENHKGIERLFVKLLRDRYNGFNDDNDTETSKILPTISEPSISQLADHVVRYISDRGAHAD